jgi:hypothetical protein
MTTVRAHFDGRVLVPDEPVDLPKDEPLELHVRKIHRDGKRKFKFPTFKVKPGAKIIRSEDVRRGEDEA